MLTTGDELHTYSQCRVHVTEKPFKATVTVRLTGVNGIGAIDRTLEVSSSSTVAEALQQGFGEDYVLTVSEYGYIGSLTGPEDFNAANAAVAYWGQYYFVNGAYDTSSPLTVPVTAGGIYGVFANESTADSDSYYGYKYNVWFHETALTAAASRDVHGNGVPDGNRCCSGRGRADLLRRRAARQDGRGRHVCLAL